MISTKKLKNRSLFLITYPNTVARYNNRTQFKRRQPMFLYRSTFLRSIFFRASHTTTSFWGEGRRLLITYLIGLILVTLTTVCSFHLGFYWKHRQGHCCFPCPKSTNQGTVHPFPTRGLAWLDFNESGTLWLCRLVGCLFFLISLGNLLPLSMLPKKKINYPNSLIKSSFSTILWFC